MFFFSAVVLAVYALLGILSDCLLLLQAHAAAFSALRKVPEPHGAPSAGGGHRLRQDDRVSALLHASWTQVRQRCWVSLVFASLKSRFAAFSACGLGVEGSKNR